MTIKEQARTIRQLRKQIPSSGCCITGCTKCCGLVPMTLWEFIEGKVSWEMIWLAYVMKKKYNKIWNGKDWE